MARVRRLTFVFRKGKVELVSEQQLEMTLPNKPVPALDQARFWYELHDAQANVVHRLAAPDPIPDDVEVFSDDPARSIQRSATPPDESVFTALLPDIPDAEEVRLMRTSQPAARDAGTAKSYDATSAVELGRFKLGKP